MVGAGGTNEWNLDVMKATSQLAGNRFEGSRPNFMNIRRYIRAWRLRNIILALACFWQCQAASVVLMKSAAGGDNSVGVQVQLAARFYGLNVEEVNAEQPTDGRKVVEALQNNEALAAVVEASALSRLNRDQVLSALRRPDGNAMPLLIVADGAGDNSSAVAEWSGGLVSKCGPRNSDAGEWELLIRSSDVAMQLAGVTLPFSGSVSCGLELRTGFSGRVLAEAARGGDKFPAYVDFGIKGQHTFVMTGLSASPNDGRHRENPQIKAFSSAAFIMTFLRYAAGEKAWHAAGQYANLTVDDPWLREPYGGLDYNNLLPEMEKHNFHTTIALIPWNFDRSRPDVVSLFLHNPQRLSISIHGNNHYLREFREYAQEPLPAQIGNIKQAIARMDQFTRNTGIPYDPVMVFPHAVAPAETLRALKTYNYWATMNSENVPLGSSQPDDSLFALRPQTVAFSNFLNVKRYSAEIPVSMTVVAINLFLNNPVLFYVHQQFFSSCMGAFNGIADNVNRMAPETKWRGLGDIAQHLYLLRLREDGEYDVLAYSPNFYLTNTTSRACVFHVRKPEDFTPAIHSASLDGETIGYRTTKSEISFDVPLQPGQTRQVKLSYVNDFKVAETSIAKTNPVVNGVRMLSDLRDLVVSRTSLGRSAIAGYHRLNLSGADIQYSAEAAGLLIILIAGRSLYGRKRRLERESASQSEHIMYTARYTDKPDPRA